MELTIRDLIWAGTLLIGVTGTYFTLKAQADKNCRELTKQNKRVDSTRKVLFNAEGKMLVCTVDVCKEKREELKGSLQSNQHKTDRLIEEIQTLREIMVLIAHELKIDINHSVIHNRRSSDT